jgi:hypothetical protein
MNRRTTVVRTALAAAVVIAAHSSIASAGECIFPFPTVPEAPGLSVFCIEGSSVARISHFLSLEEGFVLSVDMLGGTIGAVAYGIDEFGTRLSTVATTVADRDPDSGEFEAVPASDVYGDGAEGIIPNLIFYDHPVDMASTYVAVF